MDKKWRRKENDWIWDRINERIILINKDDFEEGSRGINRMENNVGEDRDDEGNWRCNSNLRNIDRKKRIKDKREEKRGE